MKPRTIVSRGGLGTALIVAGLLSATTFFGATAGPAAASARPAGHRPARVVVHRVHTIHQAELRRRPERVVVGHGVVAPGPVRDSRVYPLACRPWWAGARRIEVERRPYFFHPELGVYFGGPALDLVLTDASPPGYVYFDPCSHHAFSTVTQYRFFMRHQHHPRLLTAIRVTSGSDDD